MWFKITFCTQIIHVYLNFGKYKGIVFKNNVIVCNQDWNDFYLFLISKYSWLSKISLIFVISLKICNWNIRRRKIIEINIRIIINMFGNIFLILFYSIFWIFWNFDFSYRSIFKNKIIKTLISHFVYMTF